MRGLSNVSFIYWMRLISFLQVSSRMRETFRRVHRQMQSLDCYGSTPNAPDGLFERIEREREDICLYKRLFLDYTYGLDRIYSREEIEKAKASPSFEREYNLKYLGKSMCSIPWT